MIGTAWQCGENDVVQNPDDNWKNGNSSTQEGSGYEQLTLVVVDRFAEGLVIYNLEPLPNGECPPGPAMEIIVSVGAGDGPSAVSTSINESCEIVIDEIQQSGSPIQPSRELYPEFGRHVSSGG